jgi:hypothetical protein
MMTDRLLMFMAIADEILALSARHSLGTINTLLQDVIFLHFRYYAYQNARVGLSPRII